LETIIVSISSSLRYPRIREKNLPIVSQDYISIITVKKEPLAEKELRNSRQMIADKNPAPLDAWTLVPLDHLIRCVPLERDAAAAAARVHLDDLLLDSLSLFFFFPSHFYCLAEFSHQG
jgi:hypothetical protein